MTTPIAPVGLVFDSVDLQPSDLSFHFWISVGLHDSPEVRGKDVTIPYLAGRVARPRRFDYRRLLLPGWARGEGGEDSRAAYRETRQLLAELFDNTAEPAALEATLEDGTVLTIMCRTLSLAAVERVPSEWADLSVELEAVSEWEAAAS